jgi:hypothetical protein
MYAQTLTWVNRMGGTGNVSNASISITKDNSGNVVIAGAFSGTVDFDPGSAVANLVSSTPQNIFLAKYNASGIFQWAFNLGIPYVTALNVAADATNNIILTGTLNGTVDFNPGAGVNNLTSNGNYNVFVAKYNSSGGYLWALKVGGSDSSDENRVFSGDIVADQMGNIFTVGTFYGTIDFDPSGGYNALTSYGTRLSGSVGIFFAKYNSNGDLLIINAIDGPDPSSSERNATISLDAPGNIFVAGYFSGTINLGGPGSLVSNGSSDIFLARYDHDGNFSWNKKIGGVSSDELRDLKVDSNGDVITTGTDSFLSKYKGSNGDYIWSSQIGNANGYNIVIDSYDNILLTGNFQSTVDFDPGSAVSNLTSTIIDNSFVAKYNPNGSYYWSFRNSGGNYLLMQQQIST